MAESRTADPRQQEMQPPFSEQEQAPPGSEAERQPRPDFGKQSPMQRPAQPAELAPAYVFRASDESRYITGEILRATGGRPLP